LLDYFYRGWADFNGPGVEGGVPAVQDDTLEEVRHVVDEAEHDDAHNRRLDEAPSAKHASRASGQTDLEDKIKKNNIYLYLNFFKFFIYL
jgi:hypothetical protein